MFLLRFVVLRSRLEVGVFPPEVSADINESIEDYEVSQNGDDN